MARRISDNRLSVLERLDKIEKAINNNAKSCEEQFTKNREILARLAIEGSALDERMEWLELGTLKRLIQRLRLLRRGRP